MCKLCLGLSRRGVLAGLSAALIAAAPAPPATITGEEALHRLMQGNARYRSNHTDVRDFAAGRAARVTTHTPIASILSCSDARVGPEFVFGQGPGDLFVVRVAGNILQDEGLASLEYAAQFLGSPLIFVLGPQQLRRGRGGDQGGEGQRHAAGSPAWADRSDKACGAGGAGDAAGEPAECRDRRECSPHRPRPSSRRSR